MMFPHFNIAYTLQEFCSRFNMRAEASFMAILSYYGSSNKKAEDQEANITEQWKS